MHSSNYEKGMENGQNTSTLVLMLIDKQETELKNQIENSLEEMNLENERIFLQMKREAFSKVSSLLKTVKNLRNSNQKLNKRIKMYQKLQEERSIKEKEMKKFFIASMDIKQGELDQMEREKHEIQMKNEMLSLRLLDLRDKKSSKRNKTSKIEKEQLVKENKNLEKEILELILKLDDAKDVINRMKIEKRKIELIKKKNKRPKSARTSKRMQKHHSTSEIIRKFKAKLNLQIKRNEKSAILVGKLKKTHSDLKRSMIRSEKIFKFQTLEERDKDKKKLEKEYIELKKKYLKLKNLKVKETSTKKVQCSLKKLGRMRFNFKKFAKHKTFKKKPFWKERVE